MWECTSSKTSGLLVRAPFGPDSAEPEQAGEPIAPRIEDPWRVHSCPPDPEGCRVEFTDSDCPADGRDTIYYVRAIEAPTLAINADNLRCDRDASGARAKIDLCAPRPFDAYCLAETEQRAWSSPIFVDHGGRM